METTLSLSGNQTKASNQVEIVEIVNASGQKVLIRRSQSCAGLLETYPEYTDEQWSKLIPGQRVLK